VNSFIGKKLEMQKAGMLYVQGNKHSYKWNAICSCLLYQQQ